MTDLSHWDFAEQFSGYEAAALILGIEPVEASGPDHYRFRVVLERLELDYARAVQRAKLESMPFDDEPLKAPSGLLVSSTLEKLWRAAADGEDAPLDFWIFDAQKPLFENQNFQRRVIATWLNDSGLKSAYKFDKASSPIQQPSNQVEIDPADLPEELQAANIAFRAVLNGFGDQSATFKNRLIEFLEKNNPSLNSEAIARIATVANPDKVRGRKKQQA